jgi:hypothetical protein
MSHCSDDTEAEAFYAEDKRKLESIKRAEFEPIKPGEEYATPMKTPADWYWALYRLWWHNIADWPSDIRRGLRNIWSWFTTIWTLRDWDNFHLYAMMLKQMKAMQVGCRGNSLEAPHHKALDRCVVLLEEVIRRGQCDCSVLNGILDGRSEEKTKARVMQCVKCGKETNDMLREFGELFAGFSQGWWD